ncbi:hypothetical protein ACGFYF_02675 [Streptomyces lavendulae]|uniref:hypothetical protein n=1 Tax=Streptomyces lavendulae TaxID=1914 RepID=UPI003721A20C
MPGSGFASWLRRNVTEFRLALALVAVGSLAASSGGVLYAVHERGFPALAGGLALLITGLVMLGSGVRRR